MEANDMCRSIKVLRRPQDPVTNEEVYAAALQFVRKVSGFHKPSKANQAVFDAAVADIAAVTQRLLADLRQSNLKHPSHLSFQTETNTPALRRTPTETA